MEHVSASVIMQTEGERKENDWWVAGEVFFLQGSLETKHRDTASMYSCQVIERLHRVHSVQLKEKEELLLCLLAHCHTVMTHWDTGKEQSHCLLLTSPLLNMTSHMTGLL